MHKLFPREKLRYSKYARAAFTTVGSRTVFYALNNVSRLWIFSQHRPLPSSPSPTNERYRSRFNMMRGTIARSKRIINIHVNILFALASRNASTGFRVKTVMMISPFLATIEPTKVAVTLLQTQYSFVGV